MARRRSRAVWWRTCALIGPRPRAGIRRRSRWRATRWTCGAHAGSRLARDVTRINEQRKEVFWSNVTRQAGVNARCRADAGMSPNSTGATDVTLQGRIQGVTQRQYGATDVTLQVARIRAVTISEKVNELNSTEMYADLAKAITPLGRWRSRH